MATATTTVSNDGRTITRTSNRNLIWIAVAVLAAVFAIAIAMTAQRETTVINEAPATNVDSRPAITPGQEQPMTAPGVDTTAPQNTAPATDSETPAQ